MKRTIIIAEIGECFNGDMAVAKKLIESAKDTGCDYVKFQTLDYENIAEDDPERDWFLKIALTPDKINEIVQYARRSGIRILFTPENIKTAQWLVKELLDEVKIASNCLINKDLIGYINHHFKRVFMSTGMASLDEVNRAVQLLDESIEVYLMHCISEYPTGPLLEMRGLKALDPSDVRLNMMPMLKSLFPKCHVGYSDHTDGILAAVAAVSAGAEVIEKHITYDRQTPVQNYLEGKEYLGTDHVLSIEPDQLGEMVRQIREVESMFGDWKWERTEGEKILSEFLRERFTGD